MLTVLTALLSVPGCSSLWVLYTACCTYDAAGLTIQSLPADHVSTNCPYERNENEAPNLMHYQCTYMHQYPDPITQWKAPHDNDCRDLFNLQVRLVWPWV